MGRVGRPPSIEAPACPRCQRSQPVASHGLREAGGAPRRAFRCEDCEQVFVPGHPDEQAGASPALRASVARVRAETGAPYRLIARALDRQLGVSVSHTTVRAWCTEHEPQADDLPDEDGTLACEHLSVLWALRYEIEDETDAA